MSLTNENILGKLEKSGVLSYISKLSSESTSSISIRRSSSGRSSSSSCSISNINCSSSSSSRGSSSSSSSCENSNISCKRTGERASCKEYLTVLVLRCKATILAE
ncbi:Hypothetical predicted protein, partial [Octopus vulgaris]